MLFQDCFLFTQTLRFESANDGALFWDSSWVLAAVVEAPHNWDPFQLCLAQLRIFGKSIALDAAQELGGRPHGLHAPLLTRVGNLLRMDCALRKEALLSLEMGPAHAEAWRASIESSHQLLQTVRHFGLAVHPLSGPLPYGLFEREQLDRPESGALQAAHSQAEHLLLSAHLPLCERSAWADRL